LTADKKAPLITPTLAWFMFVTILANLGSMMSLPLLSLPAPYIGGRLWDQFSPQFPMWITAIILLVSTIPVWLRFKLPEETPEAPQSPTVEMAD
jgi:hypothetical protein